jgi:tetratricopeptide (TPR) repeat protein
MDHAGAIADFTEVIRLQPESADAYARRGLERSLFTPDFKGAMEDFNTAIRLDPAKPDYRYSRGRFRSSLGDNAGAIVDLSEALRPEQKVSGNEIIRANAFMSRGELYQNQGSLKDAIADFESALKEAPPHWPFRADTEKALEKARSAR